MATEVQLSSSLLEILRCPFCYSSLEGTGAGLSCPRCGRSFGTAGEIPLMLHPELPGGKAKLIEAEGWVEKAKAEGWYEPDDDLDRILPFPAREIAGWTDLNWLANGHSFQVLLDRYVEGAARPERARARRGQGVGGAVLA